MDDGVQIFPIAPRRRAAMMFNIVAYSVAAGMALWLWQDGGSVGWAFFGALCASGAIFTAVSLLRRRWVARMTPDAVEVTGNLGKVQSFAWEDLIAHTIDPANRVGVLFAVPAQVGKAERFGIVSLRVMGADAAARFHAALMARRPGLEKRLGGIEAAMGQARVAATEQKGI
ncbi:hypothetical protein [Roseovarius nanhaiticus]|uniref:PH domain-containing protein n=1 Tax=Roseovarius nanhaiticus TaxID=573024 RepID=A0A1N7GVI7_9RHOB|nr:hypothetical protein [Roseovarius nanhaiticus]SEL31769.1 hypothetical protein SAMN05216208_3425 [Roseovarius nanhaiticus]SIS16572.1 hypothetical protein SAMN05421666_2125 [Roseovarius nanhaiticus]